MPPREGGQEKGSGWPLDRGKKRGEERKKLGRKTRKNETSRRKWHGKRRL